MTSRSWSDHAFSWPTHSRLAPARRGTTLLEVMVVITMIGILTAICACTFPRAVEHCRADLAAANLRTIWTAQRFYRLKYQTYAPDLATLRYDLPDLLDQSILSPDDPVELKDQFKPSYLYWLDETTRLPVAVRVGSSVDEQYSMLWINESGLVSGEIRFSSGSTIKSSIRPGTLFTRANP